MATTEGTTASDVRERIDTGLADSDISDILGHVERDINREYGSGAGGFQDSQHRQDFEAVLAASRIGTNRDPRMSAETTGDVELTYDASVADELRRRVQLLDPGSAFGRPGAYRDTDRYVSSTDRGS